MEEVAPSSEKRAIAAIFSRASATHDTVGTPLFAHFGSALVAYAGVTRGERVLDVAAGAGASLFPAADRVTAEGRVIGVDLAAGMVRRLRSEIAARGVDHAAAGVADAEDLPFPAASFDVVLCAFALFFFPEPARALDAFRRVIRPGGRLALSTFAKEGQRSFQRLRGLIFAHLPDPPTPERRIEFDEPRQLLEALGRAGFEEIEVITSPLELVLEDLDAVVAWLRSTEFHEYLDRMDEEASVAFRRSAAEELAPRGGGREIRLRMDALLTRARRPAHRGTAQAS